MNENYSILIQQKIYNMEKYHIHDGEKELGEFTLDEIKNRTLKSSDYAWFEGANKWQSVEDIEELKPFVKKEVKPPVFAPKSPIITPPIFQIPSTLYSNTPKPEYANFSERLQASIADGVILNIIFGIVFYIVGIPFTINGLKIRLSNDKDFFFSFIIIVFIAWLYFALQESSEMKATIGKRAMNIVVTDGRGSKISFGRASVRFLFKAITPIIGAITQPFTKRRQTIYDMAAGTLVYEKKSST